MKNDRLLDEQLLELLVIWREGDDSERAEGRRKLNELLRSNEGARRALAKLVVDESLIDHGLRLNAMVEDMQTDHAHATVPQPKSKSKTLRYLPPALLLAAIAASLLLVLLRPLQRVPIEAKGHVAELLVTTNTVWQGPKQYEAGVPFDQAVLQLVSGTAKFGFADGAIVSVEGPAEFDLASSKQMVLRRGKIASFVPEEAQGFTVVAPGGEIIDRGTEFGVQVDDDRGTQVHVFDGSVDVSPRGTSNSELKRLTSGRAVNLAVDGVTTTVDLNSAEYFSARSFLSGNAIEDAFVRIGGEIGQGKSDALGWVSDWSVSSQGQDNQATMKIVDDRPLEKTSGNYLSVQSKVESPAAESQVNLQRKFVSAGEFDLAQPYTVEFLLRVDSDPRDLESVRFYDPPIKQPKFNCKVIDVDGTATAFWTMERSASKAKKGRGLHQMAIEQGVVYRFHIKVHPELDRYRISISDGTRTMRSSNVPGETPDFSDDVHGQFQLCLSAMSGTPLEISIDDVMIRNRPRFARYERKQAEATSNDADR